VKLVILFPGYGSQFVGMGKDLYDDSRIMQEHFDQASNCLDVNFVKLCFASSDIEIAKMSNAYAATYLVSSAIFKMLREDEGIVPDIVCGYNIGEFSALHASGGVNFVDGLYMINKYATFYEELLSGLDISVIKVTGVTGDTLKQLCEQHGTSDTFARVAVYVCKEEHIVAGHTSVVEQVIAAVGNYEEAKTEPFGVEIGLHSSLMKPVVDHVKLYLEKVDFKDAEFPFLSTTEVHTIKSGQSLRAAILEHMSSPILWNQSLDYLHDYDIFAEVGPGSSVSQMVKKMYPDKIVLSINNQKDIDNLVAIVTSEQKVEQSESTEK